MSRVNPVAKDKANPEQKALFTQLESQMGKVLNIFQVMGNSPQALKGYLALSDAARHTSLSPKLREEIALVVGQANNCQYCLAAHTFLAGKVGIQNDQILKARKGDAENPKDKAILGFAKTIVEKKGKLADQDVANLKKAGVNDTELVEIILVTMENMFTNYFNNIVDTAVDFPAAPKLQESLSAAAK